MANSTTIRIPIIDAQLLRGTPNVAATATIPVTTVENVSLKLSFDKPEANTRGSRIKQKIATLVDVALEINFPADSADAHLSAFKTACINGQPIPISVTDSSVTGASLKFVGMMGVETLDNDQQLAGIAGYKFSLFPWAVGVSGTQPALS